MRLNGKNNVSPLPGGKAGVSCSERKSVHRGSRKDRGAAEEINKNTSGVKTKGKSCTDVRDVTQIWFWVPWQPEQRGQQDELQSIVVIRLKKKNMPFRCLSVPPTLVPDMHFTSVGIHKGNSMSGHYVIILTATNHKISLLSVGRDDSTQSLSLEAKAVLMWTNQ